MWLSILSSLFSLFGPLLEKWLADWLKARLTEHAYNLDWHGNEKIVNGIDPKAGQLVLLHKVRDELWRFQVAKRAAVDAAIAAVK